jgi:hypothetical protein
LLDEAASQLEQQKPVAGTAGTQGRQDMVISAEIETRMLQKAYEDQVELVAQPDGTFLTRSAHTPAGRFYVTTTDSCSCPATAHCKHIARVREALKPNCAKCNDLGWIDYTMPNTGKNYLVSCPNCRPFNEADRWKGWS